jgi:hypothetical protein
VPAPVEAGKGGQPLGVVRAGVQGVEIAGQHDQFLARGVPGGQPAGLAQPAVRRERVQVGADHGQLAPAGADHGHRRGVVELPADRLRPGEGQRRAGQDRHRLAERRRRQVRGHAEGVGDLVHAAGVVALEVAQLLQGQQVGPFPM